MSERPLKILYISYDGAKEPIPQSQVLPYLRQFCAEGLNIYWLSFDKKQSFRSKSEKLVFKKELTNANIKWYSLSYHKKPTLLAKIYDIAQGIFYAAYIVLKEKIGIVHGRSEVASVIALFLKKIFRVNFIYDRRGFMAEDYIEGGMWRDRNSPMYKLSLYIDRRLLAEAERVVVLTKKIRNILTDTAPHVIGKISVIPCCVDLKKFTPLDNNKHLTGFTFRKNELLTADLNSKGKFIFLYFGSLGTWYMLDEMLDFFTVAKERIPNAHFLILSLSDLNIAGNKIARHKCNKSDFTTIGVSPDRIHEYIPFVNTALIFIKPVFSKLASSPTKFAESLACGVPIIINYGIGDTEQIIKDEKVGVIVEGFNENAYRKAIEELLSLSEEGLSLRERCRTAATKYFDLQYGANRYLQIYRGF